jgi:hypothetical protein
VTEALPKSSNLRSIETVVWNKSELGVACRTTSGDEETGILRQSTCQKQSHVVDPVFTTDPALNGQRFGHPLVAQGPGRLSNQDREVSRLHRYQRQVGIQTNTRMVISDPESTLT